MFLRVAEPMPDAPVILHGFAISGSYMTPTAADVLDTLGGERATVAVPA